MSHVHQLEDKHANSIAFIYRTNAQSRALEEACVAHNLPYAVFGSTTSFYKRQEIKDCLSYLRLFRNGRDRESLLRTLKTPSKGIGEAAVRSFDLHCESIEIFFREFLPEETRPTPLEVLIAFANPGSRIHVEGAPDPADVLSKRQRNALAAFGEQLSGIYDALSRESVQQILSRIISEMDLMPHFDKISKSAAEFSERKSNVNELRKAAARYDHNGPALLLENNGGRTQDGLNESALCSFLDDVALVTEMSEKVEQDHASRFVVNLMTIHASKGMEFDTVCVVGNEDGTFPSSQVCYISFDNLPACSLIVL